MTGIERLRNVAEAASRFYDVNGVMAYVEGAPLNVWLDSIADQIERETERTCRMTKKGPEFILEGWWECSECGIVYPPCNEEIARWALQYCPRCGAKVVEE